jgi:hypothetical protein
VRTRWIGLAVVVLALGVAGGYFARGQIVHTRTSTVVQIVTTAPLPPATHVLSVVVQGHDGGCLSDSLEGHTFEIRRPSNGISAGEILALPKVSFMEKDGCRFVIGYKISPDLGFFVIDDTAGYGSWGPYDSHDLGGRRGWMLTLNEG